MHKFFRTFWGNYPSSTTKQLNDFLVKYYRKNKLLPGYCTPSQSLKFTKINENISASHWREPRYINQKLKVSSLGLGTQGGQPNQQANLKMFQVLVQSIKSGNINFIDTDINFRYGKSQKTINAALNYLQDQCKISRSSLFISTKCGYIPHDIDSNLDQKKFIQILLNQGFVSKEDIVNQIHCLHPNFIQFSVQKSLLSLGVQTIDLLYLNNPSQAHQQLIFNIHRTVIGKTNYMARLEKAFQSLQKLRQNNKIRYYGIASFISFRSPPNQEGIHSSLDQIMNLAKKVGGSKHGLRFILIPFNLGMPEILMKWQISNKKTQQHIFKIAEDNQVNINICCPLYQGRVANLPFKSQILNNIVSNSAKHLQFVRSIPKQTLLTTVFSTLNTEHLRENLQISKIPLLKQSQWRNILPV